MSELRKGVAGLLLLVTIVAAEQPLDGHTKLTTPAPRSSSDPGLQGLIDAGGLVSPPCGSVPIGPTTATFTAGSSVNIEIDNVVFHFGQRHQVFIAYDADLTFVEVEPPAAAIGTGVAYQAGGVAPQSMANGAALLLTIQLPAQATPRATLQVYDGYEYYSCADLDEVTPVWRILDENTPTTKKLSYDPEFLFVQRAREGLANS